MSGNPNWNPPLQTSSVRFPRRAVETPQIPANSTTRQRPGALFQPVNSNPLTQVSGVPVVEQIIPTGSGAVLDKLYTLNRGTGEATPYNIGRQTVRGVPTPQVIIVATSATYLMFSINFTYRMSGTDHFVFTFVNQYNNESIVKNYQPSPTYLAGGLLPGTPYTLTVSPNINGITYPASAPVGPFSITAISDKNVQLQNVTISGGDKSGYILFNGILPNISGTIGISNIAVDDNFGDLQRRLDVLPPGSVNKGYVYLSNLTNGSSYIFTVTPFTLTDGIYQYGRPTTLAPYIPGPPSDLYFTSASSYTITTASLTSTYDTLVHPTPVSNEVKIYSSTFTTLCSFVGKPTTVIQDLSQTYAAFTTSTSLFSTSDIAGLISTVSATPGKIQVDITNDKGLWYSFPLANVEAGGLGYTFGNSNYTKTQTILTTASSYSILFRTINLGTLKSTTSYSPPSTSFLVEGLQNQSTYTFVGVNYANSLASVRQSYVTSGIGQPLDVNPATITGIIGNHIVSIAFTGYNPVNPGQRPTTFVYSDTYGNTYTTSVPNITINGLTDGSAYTYTIQTVANGLKSGGVPTAALTPGVLPPINVSASYISNYNVTVSFTPAGLGGADYYVVSALSGSTVLPLTVSSSPYTLVGLSANVGYYLGARSYAYTNTIYTSLSSVTSSLIQEVSSRYAQFLISPSAFPYGSYVQQLLQQYVPYTYTIKSSGQPVPPPTFEVASLIVGQIYPSNTSLYVSNVIDPSSLLSVVAAGIAAGTAYTASTSGGISYIVTSLTTSGDYTVIGGGPPTLMGLTGQALNLSLTPVSNAYTFPITSVTPVYNGSGNLQWYNVQNSTLPKTIRTFSGATTYNTTLSSTVALYTGMVPTSFEGTISSAVAYTTISYYVGPPGPLIITASDYASQRVDIYVNNTSTYYDLSHVVPTAIGYTEIYGKAPPGISSSSHIMIENLTNGSSYTFSIYAIGNSVSGPAVTTGPYTLLTNPPLNVSASFSNITPNITFSASPLFTATSYVAGIYTNGYTFNANPLQQITITSIQSVSSYSIPFNPVTPGQYYGFMMYAVSNNILTGKSISSEKVVIDPIISGPPAAPINLRSTLSSNQIIFSWSTGNVAFNETYRITEYLSVSGTNSTGGVWTNISGTTYTVSASQTVSGSGYFGQGQWVEQTLGYASFVLSNGTNVTTVLSNQWSSNLIYLTLQQSGLTYTFPITSVTPYAGGPSNVYANSNYPKNLVDIFNPALDVSASYSYGVGPRNYGSYFYTIDAYANLTFGLSSKASAQMYTLPVQGVPTIAVSGISGTTVTVSFAQTEITNAVYIVTNNYGSNVSASPYQFRNLSTGYPYTFTVAASNGAFVSVSSEASFPLYLGPPTKPLLSATFNGQTGILYITDTTLSLSTVFFDSGTQGTGCNVATLSHLQVIQNSSGGVWTGGNGQIKDTLFGFQSSLTAGSEGSASYNGGIVDAIYQFIVTPSTGSMAVSLSSYLVSIAGTALSVTGGGNTSNYTFLQDSYTLQIVSSLDTFSVQVGLSSLFTTSLPALTDTLTISLVRPAQFENFQVFAISNVGVATVSYGITDQFGWVYSPTVENITYSLSGITYTYNIFNLSTNLNLTISATPFGDGIAGRSASAGIFIYAEPTGYPTIEITNSAAVVNVPRSPALSQIDTYSVDILLADGTYIGTQTQTAGFSTSYTFSYPSLTQHASYIFKTYTSYNSVCSAPTTIGPFEMGSPYSFTGLTTTLTPSPANDGNYTLTATLNPSPNSNALMALYVYAGAAQYAVQTQACGGSSTVQTYNFTVSGGNVYTLSSSATMNTVTVTGPMLSVPIEPSPPRSVGITISSADIGNTYNGAVTVTGISPTLNVVAYNYFYSSDNGVTIIPIPAGSAGIFSATYGLSYIGYAEAATTAGGFQTSAKTPSAVSNLYLAPPSNFSASYYGTSITLNWSAGPYAAKYTVIETGNQFPVQSNITPLTASFTGSLGSNYTFCIRGQTTVAPSPSLIYSPSLSSSVVSLVTLSAYPISIDYTGTTINLSWAPLGAGYFYTVSQTLGPFITGPRTIQDTVGTNTLTTSFYDVSLSNTYQFIVSTSLNGILGPAGTTSTPTITLGTPTMTLSQFYNLNIYTLSWSQVSAVSPVYTVREVSNKYPSFTTTSTICSLNLQLGLSYTFQAYATSKGVSGAVTTLSTIYLYTLSSTFASATYYKTTISLTWAPAPQADGNLPNRYLISNAFSGGQQFPDLSAAGNTTTLSLTGTLGSNYQFAITPFYNGIRASSSALTNTISLFTQAPTGVTVDYSGTQLYVTWNGVIGTSYTVSQTRGNAAMPIGQVAISTGESSYLAPYSQTPDATTLYNFAVTASLYGITSTAAQAAVPTLVWTYPVNNVTSYYTGDGLVPTLNTFITILWNPPTAVQSGATFQAYFVNTLCLGMTNPIPRAASLVQTVQNASNVTSTFNVTGFQGQSFVPYVVATRNQLTQTDPDVSGAALKVYTAPPQFLGIGFNGTYAITLNVCSTTAPALYPSTYTLIETQNQFFPSNATSTFTFSGAENQVNTRTTVYTIPILGTRGITYNFSLYASISGLASLVDPVYGAKTLALITNPVSQATIHADYFGPTITLSWADAYQCNATGTGSNVPNGGYTIYDSALNYPYTTLYSPSSIKIPAVAGSNYLLSVEAVNNNVGSGPQACLSNIYLYMPVISNVTYSNQGTNVLTDVSTTLNWPPDLLATSYTTTKYTAQQAFVKSTTTIDPTVTFTGSIDASYYYSVVGIYKGICGNPFVVQVSNQRPILTIQPLTNTGNFVYVSYFVTNTPSTGTTYSVALSPSGTLGNAVFSSSGTNTTIFNVSTFTTAVTYIATVSAFYNGLPSLSLSTTITLQAPQPPGNPLTFNWNNSLVTISWASSAANASQYVMSAYDLSSGSLVSTQYIPQTYTSFNGSLGHSFSVSVTALSSTGIPSTTCNVGGTITIPEKPTGLVLDNKGSLMSVSWTTIENYGYSFYISNVAAKGVIVYSNLFAVPGDTYGATIKETYSVSLYAISPSNVQSANAAQANIYIYQPLVPFVTGNATGADVNLNWQADISKTCVFWIRNNYEYSTLLFPDPTSYTGTGSCNGWVRSTITASWSHDPVYNNLNVTASANYTATGIYNSYLVRNLSANLAGQPYVFNLIPIWNAVQGPTVYTNTQNPIILYKPTQPAQLSATGGGNVLTINWQSAVIYTNPPAVIPTYLVEVSTVSAALRTTYPSISGFTVGNTQTYVGSFDTNAQQLSISVTAVTPGLPCNAPTILDPIYGYTSNINFYIPSATSLFITQTSASAQTLNTTIPIIPNASTVWFYVEPKVPSPLGGYTTAKVQTISAGWTSDGANILRNISLGFYYTISAIVTADTNPPGPLNTLSPVLPNPNPYPAVTFSPSAITATHQGMVITVSWKSVDGANYSKVQTAVGTQTSGTGGYGSSEIYQNVSTYVAITTNGSLPFSYGGVFNYTVQAFTPTTNTWPGLVLGTSVDSVNIGSALGFTLPVTLTVPPIMQNLVVTQSYSNAIVTWSPFSTTALQGQNPDDVGTPLYTVRMSNGGSLVAQSSTADISLSFAMSPTTAGNTYTFNYFTTYKGISSTDAGAVIGNTSLVAWKPSISSVVLIDNNDKTATISGTLTAGQVGTNVSGNWFMTSTTGTKLNDGTPPVSSFSSNLGVRSAGASLTCNVVFVATTGLSAAATTNTLTFPNPQISSATTTDTGGVRTFSLVLNSTGTTGTVGAGTPQWTIAVPTGATGGATTATGTNPTVTGFTVTNSTWQLTSLVNFPVNSITLTYDGFTVSNATAIGFTEPNIGFSPVLTNTAGILTLSATIPSGGPAANAVSWTYPPTINAQANTGNTFNGQLANFAYGAIVPARSYSTTTNLLGVYEGYSNSVAITSLGPLTITIGSATFVNAGDGTNINLTLSLGPCSGGFGTPTWGFPSNTVNASPFTQLSNGSRTSSTVGLVTISYFTVVGDGQYKISSNTVTLAYGGVTICNSADLTASSSIPRITATATKYQGCIEDSNYTGTPSITLDLSSDIAGVWSVVPAFTYDYPLNAPTYTPATATRAENVVFGGASKYVNSTTPNTFANMVLGSTNVTPQGFSMAVSFSLSLNFSFDTPNTSVNFHNLLRVCPSGITYDRANLGGPYRFPAIWISPNSSNMYIQVGSTGLTSQSLTVGSNYTVLFDLTFATAGSMSGTVKVNGTTVMNGPFATGDTTSLSTSNFYLWLSDPTTAFLYPSAAKEVTMNSIVLKAGGNPVTLSNYTGIYTLNPAGSNVTPAGFNMNNGSVLMGFTLTLNNPNTTTSYLNILRCTPDSTDFVDTEINRIPAFWVVPTSTSVYWQYLYVGGTIPNLTLCQPYTIVLNMDANASMVTVTSYDKSSNLQYSNSQTQSPAGLTSGGTNFKAYLFMTGSPTQNNKYPSAAPYVSIRDFFMQTGSPAGTNTTVTTVTPNNALAFSNTFNLAAGSNVTPGGFNISTGNFQITFDVTFIDHANIAIWKNIFRTTKTLATDRYPIIQTGPNAAGINYIQVQHNNGNLYPIGPFPIGDPVRVSILQSNNQLSVTTNYNGVASNYSAAATNVSGNGFNAFMSSPLLVGAGDEPPAKNLLIRNFSYIVDGVPIYVTNGNANGPVGQYKFNTTVTAQGIPSSVSSAIVNLVQPALYLKENVKYGTVNNNITSITCIPVLPTGITSLTSSLCALVNINGTEIANVTRFITDTVGGNTFVAAHPISPNDPYTITSGTTSNGILGGREVRSLAVVAAVANLTWGSDGLDSSLYSPNQTKLNWTPYVPSANTASYIYRVYTGTSPGSAPTTTPPGGTLVTDNIAVTTGTMVITLTASPNPQSFYITTVYTDPTSLTKYYASSLSVNFTYNATSVFSDNRSLATITEIPTSLNLYTYLQVEATGGGGGGGGGSFNGNGNYWSGGGGGGKGNFTGRFPIKNGYQLSIDVGGKGLGGFNGVDNTGTSYGNGGGGGNRGFVVYYTQGSPWAATGGGGTSGSAGIVSVGPSNGANGSGSGGGGGQYFRSGGPYASLGGGGGGGGSSVVTIKDAAGNTVFMVEGAGGGGGAINTVGFISQGGNGGSTGLVTGATGGAGDRSGTNFYGQTNIAVSTGGGGGGGGCSVAGGGGQTGANGGHIEYNVYSDNGPGNGGDAADDGGSGGVGESAAGVNGGGGAGGGHGGSAGDGVVSVQIFWITY